MAKQKPTKRAKEAPSEIYLFKITLLDVAPPIWRQIQVADCTLDQLHEHIQTAMGWTNSHLHQFEIDGQRHGDPELLGDGFAKFDGPDSRMEKLSEILSKHRKGFRFHYEYDFGDSWIHEIQFEGKQPAEPGAKYPRCVEGARAGPPEDCGGVWGYQHMLEVLATPSHPEYEDLHEWAGNLKPEAFNPPKMTKAMQKGLPDWRSMR